MAMIEMNTSHLITVDSQLVTIRLHKSNQVVHISLSQHGHLTVLAFLNQTNTTHFERIQLFIDKMVLGEIRTSYQTMVALRFKRVLFPSTALRMNSKNLFVNMLRFKTKELQLVHSVTVHLQALSRLVT